MKNALNYTYEQLKIFVNEKEVYNKGYDLIEFKLSSEVNKHTKLILKARIKEAYKNEWDIFTRQSGSRGLSDERVLSFLLAERKYFSGIIQKGATFVREDGDFIVEVEVCSKSEIMDRDKNYRVYQNSKIKYIDIVKDILNRHKYIDIVGVNREFYSVDNNVDERLSMQMKSQLIIQYDESDWEFLVRIMSHIGIGVFNTENGSLSLGLSKDVTTNKQWNIITGDIGRGIDKFDNIYYELASSDFFLLGDNVIQSEKQNMGYVNKSEVSYNEGKFYGEYHLKQFEYWFPYISNKNIKGSKIDCKVVEVPLIGEKEGIAIMTVDFTEGMSKLIKNKEKNRARTGNNPVKLNAFNDWISYKENDGYFYFPYSTFYSKANTGFFCTPEIDDIVPIIFESDEECEGFVGFSINNPMSGRFSNPYYRNYTTHPEEGTEECCFEFSVSKDNYLINARNLYKEEFLHKVIEAGETINVNCENNISIDNKNTITMKTDHCSVRVTSDYTENVEGNKKIKTSSLKEQISESKNISCQVYDLTAGVYKTNK